MREELPEYIQRTFVYLIHSILRRGEEGLAGGMKSSPPCLSHYLNLAGADSETLSSQHRTLCPPPLSTMACYIVHTLTLHLHAFF